MKSPFIAGDGLPTVDVDVFARLYDRMEPEPNSGCWLWLGKPNTYGYGVYCYPGGARIGAHRAMWIALMGPIGPGNRVAVWGWAKRGPRGKRKMWVLSETTVNA